MHCRCYSNDRIYRILCVVYVIEFAAKYIGTVRNQDNPHGTQIRVNFGNTNVRRLEQALVVNKVIFQTLFRLYLDPLLAGYSNQKQWESRLALTNRCQLKIQSVPRKRGAPPQDRCQWRSMTSTGVTFRLRLLTSIKLLKTIWAEGCKPQLCG